MNKYIFWLASFLVFINCKKTLSEGKNYTIETLMSNNRSSGGYFSKDASKLIYSSDKTGVFNIYEVDLSTKKETPKPLFYIGLEVFVGGPTWARTRDQLIMSQLL